MNKLLVFIIILLLIIIFSGLAFFISYVKKQNLLFDEASERIKRIVNGNQNERIPCNKEGSIYSLFHEINSLASILNSHVDKEAETGEFLKKTIQDISHQLKTPISALTIYNEILQDESLDKVSIKKFTELSEQELNRINNLVQNLLKITKLDSKTICMDFRIQNSNKIIDTVFNHFDFRAEQEGKTLKTVFSNNVKENENENYLIRCDSIWIIEALDNIVKNALDHSKSGDTIEIIQYPTEDLLCIQIKDNGRGIHEEDIYHIFKRFYRSRFSTDKSGIGLGLSLSKSIIELHGGTIEVDSVLNKGTCFSVYLPLIGN